MYLKQIDNEKSKFNFFRCFIYVAMSIFVLSKASALAATSTTATSSALTSSSLVSGTVLNNNVKNYKEWKSAMIADSENRIKHLKENINKNRQTANISTSSPLNTQSEGGLSSDLNRQINQSVSQLQNLIEKEEHQLTAAKDLSISDYFVGYLTKQKSLATAIKEVSGRLSADEVAELMQAYADLIK